MKERDALRNEAGRTLPEFLQAYRPGDYDRPSVTVDVAVFTREGEVLLIRRGDHPNIGRWALPGGFIEMKETLYESAARELWEETGVKDVPLHSLGVFGAPGRDPRTRIITAAFAAEVPRAQLLSQIQAGDDASDAALFRWNCERTGFLDIPPVAGDYPELPLPCSAWGEGYTSPGEGYLLTLEGAGRRLSALLALSKEGVELLLASPAPSRPHDDAIAGDHGLILFSALRNVYEV